MADKTFENITTDKSSIKGLGSNVLGAAIFVICAGVAWIPVVGYFAWIIPLVLCFIEKRSFLLRFYSAEAFVLGLVRMVFDVVFDSIAAVAQQTVALYSNTPEFVEFYGNVASPGNGALIIGGIFAVILTLVSLIYAFAAFYQIPAKLPLVSSACKTIAGYRFLGNK